jgi:hypothetical protein
MRENKGRIQGKGGMMKRRETRKNRGKEDR